jgi:uncharacterized phage protein gp47/JayE
MSLVTPSTATISANIIAQLESALSQTIPLLPKAFARVLAKTLAAVFILVYKYAGFMFLQIFVAFATLEETEINGKLIRPLVQWGRLIGVGDPIAAAAAEHTITVTVTNQTGSLAAGAQLIRSETGVIYQTVAAVLLNAATVTAAIIAVSDQDGNGGVGEIGNLEAGDIVSFANPLPNVATDAVILARTVDGEDAEDVETYRARVLERFRARPQGGAYADYRIWGEEVAGVVNIYPYTGDPGEVDVYVEVSTVLDPDGIPDGAKLAEVAAAIELDDAGLATRRPANAAVNTLAISRTAFDVNVDGLDVLDVASTQTSIEDGLDEYLRAREPFIVGLSTLPRDDRITAAALGGLVEEIVSANGGTVTVVTMTVSGDPFPAYTLGDGEKAKLGTVTYT